MSDVLLAEGLPQLIVRFASCSDVVEVVAASNAWAAAISGDPSWRSALRAIPTDSRCKAPSALTASQLHEVAGQLLQGREQPFCAWRLFRKYDAPLGTSAPRGAGAALPSAWSRRLLGRGWCAMKRQPDWFCFSASSPYVARSFPERWTRDRGLCASLLLRGEVDLGRSECQVQVRALSLTDDGYLVLWSHHMLLQERCAEGGVAHVGMAVVGRSLEEIEKCCRSHPGGLLDDLMLFARAIVGLHSLPYRPGSQEWTTLREGESLVAELEEHLM